MSQDTPELADTGIEGLDAVLGGGWPLHHTCLVQGGHGAGKTTLGLQFCMAGARKNEKALLLSTCESPASMREVAGSHGWSLDGVELRFLDPRESFGEGAEQSFFHPAEVELPATMQTLLEIIREAGPRRLVIDSLSEIRLLSPDGRWFRRQMLALKEVLADLRCTTLLLDDLPGSDQPVNSIVHGVLELEQLPTRYGRDRRRLRVAKLRGRTYASGFHDFRIRTGGLEVYPRMVAGEPRLAPSPGTFSSGVEELDALFGGGMDRATASLFLGPSGTGKSVMATQFALASAQRGERCAIYLFDERVRTLMDRARGLGLDLQSELERERIEVTSVDPAEMTPGEFAHNVRRAVTEGDVEMVVLDSLFGYFNAMPDERLLSLHLHEMLSFLGHHGVTTILIMTQHGLPGTPRHAPFDLSYISDSVLLFHSFEFAGELRRAISAYKRRGGAHENTLREFRIGPRGVSIGEPLRAFQGIMSGLPRFTGDELPHVEPGPED